MRAKLALYLGGLCLICQGCSPLIHAARTTLIQSAQYPRALNDFVDNLHNSDLAKAAWKEFQQENAECKYSCDFRLGFKNGYADYLYAGGGCNPPAVPPRCYWKAKFETVEGHQAIQDWFAGFRQGAASAKQSGYRELATLPSSLTFAGAPPPPPLVTAVASQPAHPSPAPALPPDDFTPLLDNLLPPPRKVPR